MRLRDGKTTMTTQDTVPETEWVKTIEGRMEALNDGIQKLLQSSNSQSKTLSDGVQTLISESTSTGKNLASLSKKMDSEPENRGQNTSLKPLPFSGFQREDSTLWLSKFQSFCDFNGWEDKRCRDAFRLLLNGPAEVWYNGLTVAERDGWETVKTKFTDRFSAKNNWVLEQELVDRKQMQDETVESYVIDMQRRFQQLTKNKEERLSVFVRNLHTDIRAFVVEVS